MFITTGFLHPRHGFLFANYIDSEFVTEWLANASIYVATNRTLTIDGVTVSTDDLTPHITTDFALDRLFDRIGNGPRRTPDHLAYDPIKRAIMRAMVGDRDG